MELVKRNVIIYKSYLLIFLKFLFDSFVLSTIQSVKFSKIKLYYF